MQEEAKSSLFIQQMKSMRPQQLTNMLKCNICFGLYRFAHTIVQCGHTFCQQCIFTYVKSFKGRNPTVKCPQCHALVESNYARSIMKDVFKQSLVDLMQPSYCKEQETIIKRVQTLFPDQDLQFLLDQFKFSTYESPKIRKKASQKNIIVAKLLAKIKQKLNLTFETFAQQILDQQKYKRFLEIIKSSEDEARILDIRPKSDRQTKYVGLKSKMKAKNLTVQKLKRFLQKKALQRISKQEQYVQQFINTEGNRLDIRIQLYIKNQKLAQNQNIQQCTSPIYYVLL